MRLTTDEARRALLAAVGPRPAPEDPAALLERMGMVQLDPLDRIGNNADLVTFARTTTLGRGALHTAPGFEHFAKEWCLLPPRAFPFFRQQAESRPHDRQTDPMRKVEAGVLTAVLDEVTHRGPLTTHELGDHGRRELTPSSWASSAKLGTLALKVLALRARLVVCGRKAGQRIYDVPERVFGPLEPPATPFLPWAVRERVRAAGFLAESTGPWWGAMEQARKDGTVEQLIEAGDLQRVEVEGSRRTYLIEPWVLEATPVDPGRLVLLGPLDPLLWNRELVQRLFGFRYVWEVYKPAAKREWGYYVVPLLQEGRLVGRLEAHLESGQVVVDQLWREDPAFDDDALQAALTLHAAQCHR